MVHVVQIKFQQGSIERDCSHLVRSYTVYDRRCSENFRHAINTRRLVLSYDSETASFLSQSQTLATCWIDGNRDFTGRVSSSVKFISNGASAGSQPDVSDIEIELEDYTYKLERNIEHIGSIGREAIPVCSPSNPGHSAVHLILSAAGLSANITESIPTVLPALALESGTLADALDTLLHEYGYTYYFNAFGQVELFRWMDPQAAGQLDEQIMRAGVEIEQLQLDYDAVEVSYYSLKQKTGVLLYMADLPFGSDSRRSGWPIQPGYLWPEEANVRETWWSYTDVALANTLNERNEVVKNEDFSGIVLTKNHRIEDRVDDGVVREIALFRNKEARVAYRNNTASSKNIYYCNIIGDAIYKAAKHAVSGSIVEEGEKVLSYEASYIHEEPAAEAYCAARLSHLRYGWRYTLRTEHALSFYVYSLQDPYSGTQATVMLLEHEWTLEDDQHIYKAVAVGSVQITPVAQKSSLMPAPAWASSVLALQLERVPTFYDVQYGYNASGGTTVPSVPILKLDTGPNAIYISIDVQKNLTNYSHDELQVTDNPAGDWYALRMDGQDWKGGVDAVTIAPSSFVVHANIPPVSILDPSTGQTANYPRSLWYRCRRITKLGLRSSWSTPIQGITKLVDGTEIAEHSITANKLSVGVLNAVLANIRDSLVIDQELGYAAENEEGNERAHINEQAISFQRLIGAIWQTVCRIGLDGLLASTLFSSGPLIITNNKMTGPTGRRANKTDIGISYPSASAKVFHFDGDLLDQNQQTFWQVSGGVVTFDTVDVAIKAASPFSTEAGCLAGGVRLDKTVGNYLHGSWWIDLWVRTTGIDESYELLYIGNAVNYLRLLHKESPSYWFVYADAHYGYASDGYFGKEDNIKNFSLEWKIDNEVFAQELSINEEYWVHVAAGHDPNANAATVIVAGSIISIPNFKGISGATLMEVVVNRDYRGLKIDELMIDTTVTLNVQMVLARNEDRIPFAAVDYASDPFVLEAKDPNNVIQNLIRSSYVSGQGWICKLPDGTQFEWAGDGQPVVARRWR